jgi:nicastrin
VRFWIQGKPFTATCTLTFWASLASQSHQETGRWVAEVKFCFLFFVFFFFFFFFSLFTSCSEAPASGVVGKLYYASTDSELDDVFAKASSFTGSPAAVLIASEFLSFATLQKLLNNDHVAGVIVADGPRPRKPFSPAVKFPNREFGLANPPANDWNSDGYGLIMTDYKKPVFSLGANDTAMFLARLNQSAATGSRLSVELQAAMKTKTDSVTCLRRGWCDNLGGVSVIASLSSVSTLQESSEIVAVMASVDSNAMMATRATGAVSDMSGTVALLGAFRALAEAYGPNSTCDRPSVFHWFNAEAWGYAGSKRFVMHAVQGHGIYNESSVWTMLEAKQVGSKTPTAKLTIHAPNNAASDMVAAELATASARHGIPITRFSETAQVGLPPASLQSFLLKRAEHAWPGFAVLTDHGAKYENPFYHSMFDTFENVDPVMVCNAAKVLAETVAQLQNYHEPKPLLVNCSFVTEVLRCLSQDLRCPLFVSYLPEMASAPEFPSHYAGMFRGSTNPAKPIKILHAIVTELNSPYIVPNKTCGRNADCFNNVDRFFCIRGSCVDRTRSFYWDAVSPTEDPDNTALFTESQWIGLGLRLFEEDSPELQLGGFLLGVVLSLGTGVISWWMGTRVLL